MWYDDQRDVHRQAPGLYQAIAPVFVADWDGARLKARVAFGVADTQVQDYPVSSGERRYALREVKQRLHQASFREAVIAAYEGRRAISGLPEVRLLNAVHIIQDTHEALGQPMIETGDPSNNSRTVLWAVCALFAVLLTWALFAKLDIVAVAQGRLVPQTYVKIVQPAEAGIIREILVKDGDSVQRGDVLVRLDPTVNAADSVAVSRELALERLQLRRIEAELAAKPVKRNPADDEKLFLQVEAQALSHRQSFLDSIAQEAAARERARRELEASREVLKKLETTLPSYEKSAAAYEKLAEQKLMGSLQAEERRREAAEKAQDLQAQLSTVASLDATITEREQRLAQLRSAYLSDLNQQRLQTVGAINRLEQQQGKLTYQEGLLELRAPQAGIVKELATTTLGAVVQPGTVILSLVPANEPLRAEVLVENKDIGFVRKGQPVRVKLAAFQFQKYGMLEGTVQTVSADSTSNETTSSGADRTQSQNMSFKALIQLREQQLKPNGLALPLAAGMQVSAEIIQGERTVLEYLLSPVQRVTSEAAMER